MPLPIRMGGPFLEVDVEVGEPQRRLFTAIGTDDESYSAQVVGVPTNGQVLAYDSGTERFIPQNPTGGTFTVAVEEALQAASLIDQDPVGLGVALQITLGDAQTTPFFDVDVLGNITCLQGDEYTFRFRFGVGREGAAGESQLYLRSLVNGVPTQYTAVAIVDNPRIEIPATFEGTIALNTNDVVTLEIIRDTDGNDSGGLRAGIPDVPWNPSPSALVTITRFVAAP